MPATPHQRRRLALRVSVVALAVAVTLVVAGPAPAGSSASTPAGSRHHYRIEIPGRFPPRALRYEISASGRTVAYGTPSADGRSLVGFTDDPAALTEELSVTPGPVGPPGGETPAVPTRRSSRAAPPPGVARKVYDFGDQSLQLAGLKGKVEVRADVHYPKGPGGPYPLVLFLHGNHWTCFEGKRTLYAWPCPKGTKPIPNYEGYDYLAGELAAHGYVVVSVSANGVNVRGNRVDDTGMRQRGELLEAHLDRWKTWATTGAAPFGNRFVGKVDLSRIGVMGHSRGGEGAVWQVIVDRERPDPYGIDAVLALAPVDFTRAVVNDVPLAVVLPYCDGDVYDLQGMHFFDDARYAMPGDPTPKHAVTVFGANHNFFNTVWTPGGGYPGGFDDGSAPCDLRLRPGKQRSVGAAFMVSFFRRYVGGETSLDPIWTGAVRPPKVPAKRALVSYVAPDTPTGRSDLLRFTDASSLSTNVQGGAVTKTGFSRFGWCADAPTDVCLPVLDYGQDVHSPGLARGELAWTTKNAEMRTALPVGWRDVSGFDALQLRVALDPSSRLNKGAAEQQLIVLLADGEGHEVAVSAADVGGAAALAFPSGIRAGRGHVILQQIRFPLARFATAGVDLTDVRSISLRFPALRGKVLVSDLAFSRGDH